MPPSFSPSLDPAEASSPTPAQPEAAAGPRQMYVQCLTPAGLHRVAYKEWGDPANPAVVVCAHGLTRVSGDFDALAAALAPRFRVACPDMPGRGRSDWLTNPNLYQVPVYVADMVTLIARLDARSLYWFGTSMGGLIGMGLASLAGSPIERLILNDVGPVISAAGVERIGEYLSQPIRFKSLDEAEQYIRMISAPFGEHTDAEWRHLTEISIRRDGDEWVTHYDPAIAIPFKAAVAANPEGTDTLLWNVYDTVTARTLSVRGELSDLLTPETQREMAARGPKAELVTIPKVGHAPMFMHSDQIAIVEEFFSRA